MTVESLIKQVLKHEGLVLNEDLITVDGIAEYLDLAPSHYTIYDYIEDTICNYPEYFK